MSLGKKGIAFVLMMLLTFSALLPGSGLAEQGPDCLQHEWTEEIESRTYSVCPSAPGRHYLSEATYCMFCRYCHAEQPGTERKVSYTEENSPEVSGHLYDESGVCAFPGCGMKFSDVRRSQSAPMQRIAHWDGKLTFFETAVETAMLRGEKGPYKLAKAVYQNIDLGSLLINAILSDMTDDSEQAKQDQLMEDLIRENFMSYLSYAVGDELDTERAIESLDMVYDGLEVVQLEIPASGKLISIESISKGLIQGDALKMFQVCIGSASILCESKEAVKAVYLMQCTHDFAISYLSHLQRSAHPDSSLYRVCEKMIREVNLKWPLGEGVPDELKQASNAEIAKMISAAGLDKLISLTYENDSILIRVFEEWNYPHTSEFLSSAAGVLIAFKAGAVLGHLITPFTGRTLQEEEELLRLYIASAEIKSALYSAPDEAKYDLASLYLTAEEAGSKKAYDYYLDMDLSDVVKQLSSLFFQPEAEDSTKQTLELIQGQLDELNTIRDEMGLPKGQDIMELLDFLPRSDPSSLYGTWDLDWHNEKAYENQTDIVMGMIAADILGGHLQITIDEHELGMAYFERDGSLSSNTRFQPQTFPINITDSIIDDGSGNVIQWRLSLDEQTLYLYQDAANEDQVFRFFRIGGTSNANVDSSLVPPELRGNWVVAEALEQNTDDAQTDLLRDPSSGKKLEGDLSFTDDTMHLETGTYLNHQEILGMKVTGTAGALVSEDGRELHWQFNEDRTAVAIADDFGLRIRAFRPTGKKDRVQLPDYPVIPEYQNPDLMDEWVLMDIDGDQAQNFTLADTLITEHAYFSTMVLKPGALDSLYPDPSYNSSSPCRYTRAFLEAGGFKYFYKLDGDWLTLRDSEGHSGRYARKNSQAEEDGVKALYRIAEEGYYIFNRFLHGEAAVEKYLGYAGVLQIPEMTEDGYPVVSVDHDAFQRANRLFKLILHEGIKRFDYQKIPTLKAIEVDEDNAAYKAVDGVLLSRDGTTLVMYPIASERTVYEIPEGVATIAHNAFDGAANLEEIIFPSTLRTIGKSAFAGCTALRQVSLPENMRGILDKAFENCTQLEEVWIPQTAGTEWAPSAFDGCTSLRAIHTAANTNVDTVLKNAGLPVVSDLIGYRIEQDAEGNVHVTSDGILPYVSLGDEAWAQLVSPGKSVILEGTWSGAHWSLALSETDVSLTLADALRGMDYTAEGTPWAAYLSQIRTVWYESENVRWTLDEEGLLRIAGEGDMPDYLSYGEYDDGTFSVNRPWPMEKVRAVEMDARLTSVSRYAFARHTALEKIILPENLQKIENSAFAGCSALAEVVIPDTVVSIREHAFENCTVLKSVVIPDSVTRLDAYAFANCSGLETLTLGSGIQEIKENTFRGCRMLRQVMIPSSVRKIEPRAFEGCAGLMDVYIPEEVSEIAPNAFSECPGIQAVHCVQGSHAEYWASLPGYPVSYEMDPEKAETPAPFNPEQLESVSTATPSPTVTAAPAVISTPPPAPTTAAPTAAPPKEISISGSLSEGHGLNMYNEDVRVGFSMTLSYDTSAILYESMPEGTDSYDGTWTVSDGKLCVSFSSGNGVEREIVFQDDQCYVTFYGERVKARISKNAVDFFFHSKHGIPNGITIPDEYRGAEVPAIPSSPTPAPQTTPPDTGSNVTAAPVTAQPAQNDSVPETPKPAAVQIAPGFTSAIVKESRASSYIAGKDPSAYLPDKMTDGNEETAWQFSTKESKLGECYAYFDFDSPVSISELWIKNGFWRITNGYDQYTRNSRPKKIGIAYLYEGETEYTDKQTITLKDDKKRLDWQRHELGRHERVVSVRLRILSIYKGTKFKTDVCISEVAWVDGQ